jgi:hypothetical protein
MSMTSRKRKQFQLCCLAALLFTPACASQRQLAHLAPTPSGDDPALFAAVVRAIADSASLPLFVDPRPLKADPVITHADSSSFADVPLANVQARAAVLQRLGVSETANPTDRGCLGSSVPPLPAPHIDTRARYCPDQSILVAAIGLGRPGGAYYTYGLDERATGLSHGDWAVRVILTSLGRYGSNRSVYDYVMHVENGRWQLVKSVALVME